MFKDFTQSDFEPSCDLKKFFNSSPFDSLVENIEPSFYNKIILGESFEPLIRRLSYKSR